MHPKDHSQIQLGKRYSLPINWIIIIKNWQGNNAVLVWDENVCIQQCASNSASNGFLITMVKLTFDICWCKVPLNAKSTLYLGCWLRQLQKPCKVQAIFMMLYMNYYTHINCSMIITRRRPKQMGEENALS